jgi:hypothetical protein
MKKTILLALAACLILITSCNKAQHITAGEENLNLIAPSGKTIATTIADLKTKAAKIVWQKYGTGASFELLTIEYFPAPKGYAASVYYRLKDGSTDSYLTIGGIAYRMTETGVELLPDEPITGREADDGGIKCEKKPECTTECKQTTVLNASTGQLEVDCGCAGKCVKKQI